jgi:hypothetical protein
LSGASLRIAARVRINTSVPSEAGTVGTTRRSHPFARVSKSALPTPQAGFGVHHNVVEVTGLACAFLLVCNSKRHTAALRPPRRAAVRVAVNQKRRTQTLQKSNRRAASRRICRPPARRAGQSPAGQQDSQQRQ